MGRYSHLSIEEREDIMVRWLGREGVSQIAREIGRDKSTVSREIARNGWVQRAGCRVRYRASTAQARAASRLLEAIGTSAYSCFPRPRQRDTNENSLGLLRECFPNDADLSAVSDEDVVATYADSNRRPRKRLARKCPW